MKTVPPIVGRPSHFPPFCSYWWSSFWLVQALFTNIWATNN